VLATWITLSRFPLLALVVVGLYRGSRTIQLCAAATLLVGLLLDTVDGIVARRRNETSLLGSVLDIAADRTYEIALWVCFAEMGLIPVLIPLIVVARTAVTDALRAIGVRQGAVPFAQVGTRIGTFLVASAWMRTGYSLSKVLTFCGLATVLALGVETRGWGAAVRALAWLSVALCLLRGLPVVVEAVRRHGLVPAGAGRLEEKRPAWRARGTWRSDGACR
jgi:phosphatidylglycerophosphate synthase